jgi:hypothetical protein
MSFGKTLASILLMFSAVSFGGSTLNAQSSARGTGLIVAVTGVADAGGMFTGALIVQRFAPQANSVVAVGTVTGTLTAGGTVRNLVTQVALPLDTNASRARLNTDSALAQSSCDVLHVELGSASINVLGSTLGLNPIAFDIASTAQAGAASTTVSTTAATNAGTSTTSDQAGTGATAASGTTTQPSGTTQAPGVVAAAPQKTATQTPLGSLLCSVDGFRDVSRPSQLVQQLNGILAALGTTEGS